MFKGVEEDQDITEPQEVEDNTDIEDDANGRKGISAHNASIKNNESDERSTTRVVDAL